MATRRPSSASAAEVLLWEVTPLGPFNQPAPGSGFEHFFGLVGGEANQCYLGRNACNGEVTQVQIDIGDDEHSHLTNIEDRFKLSVAKQ